MVAEAFRRVPLPPSVLITQPPGGETLVNLDTVFRTTAAPFTTSLTLLGQQVTLDIEPSRYHWTHGDGTDQTTVQPGREWVEGSTAWDPGMITHTYLRKGSVRAGLTIVWRADWRLNGGPTQAVEWTVSMSSGPQPIEVLEAKPVLVG